MRYGPSHLQAKWENSAFTFDLCRRRDKGMKADALLLLQSLPGVPLSEVGLCFLQSAFVMAPFPSHNLA